jgi:hypothetical protein
MTIKGEEKCMNKLAVNIHESKKLNKSVTHSYKTRSDKDSEPFFIVSG